jgi:tetratricopeptide (TPR) repeat protein/predicted aspartyl protease
MIGRISMAIAGLCASIIPLRPALAQDTCRFVRIAQFPVQMDGPRATVAVTINGTPTRLWLATGASFGTMSQERATELKLDTEAMRSNYYLAGIGGVFKPRLAFVRDFGLAGATLHDVAFIVGGSDLGIGTLGANLLGVPDVEFDFAKGTVNFYKAQDCGDTNLAYWSAGMALGKTRLLIPRYASDRRIHIEVTVNGHALRAVLDSSMPFSTISSRAAKYVGIDLTSSEVVAATKMTGLGQETRKSWIAKTQLISIGGETIRNSPIRVIEDPEELSDDMILGMDFMMSHHLLVSQAQQKMYLTYNGGPVFLTSGDAAASHLTIRTQNMGAAEKAAEPTTAAAFAGRGSARLASGDATGAIADYSEAVRLAPGSADLLAERARAYQRANQPDPALQDITAALAITPNDHRLLTRRAQIRLGRNDLAGALADTNTAAAALPAGSLDTIPVVTLYERLGQADRGLALLDPVIRLHREDSAYPRLLNARAWNRALANTDLDRALKDANTAIQRSDADPIYIDTRALVQLRRKDYQAAIADANAGLGKNPKMATSLYFRGLANIASGNATAGSADIAAARALQPAVDARLAPYGLAAPKTASAQPSQPGGGDDDQ